MRSKRRMIALLLCLLVCVSAVSGCGSFGGSCASCENITSIFISEPTMTLVGQEPYRLPSFKGFSGASELTARLAAYYRPVIEILKDCNETETVVSLEYELEDNGSDYILHSSIVGKDKGRIVLDDIVLDTKSKKTVLPEIGLEKLEFLRDGEFAAAYLRLTDAEIPISLDELDETVTLSELLSFAVGYIEIKTGTETDIGKISKMVSGSSSFLKACENDLTDFVYEEDAFGYATGYSLARCLSGVLKLTSSKVCGTSSDIATVGYVLDMCALFGKLFRPCVEESAASGENLTEKWLGFYGGLISGADVPDVSESSTRGITARLFVSMYEEGFGDIPEDDFKLCEYSDTADEGPLKATAASLMSSFPSSRLFSPLYRLHQFEVPDIVRNFTECCYNKFLTEKTGMQAGEKEILTPVTYREMVKDFGLADRHVDTWTLEVSESDVRAVNNGRTDFDWYLTQYDYTTYADVNCMPTISAMAIRWATGRKDVTQHILRDKFLPEYKNGWWLWQVEQCLKDYKVDFVKHDLDLDSMLSDLDDGCIILSQMSEAPIEESGHCFVIYGYEKRGDSVMFYINDPGVSYDKNKYGEPPGKDERLDGAYVYWIMDRFTYEYIAVKPA